MEIGSDAGGFPIARYKLNDSRSLKGSWRGSCLLGAREVG